MGQYLKLNLHNYVQLRIYKNMFRCSSIFEICKKNKECKSYNFCQASFLVANFCFNVLDGVNSCIYSLLKLSTLALYKMPPCHLARALWSASPSRRLYAPLTLMHGGDIDFHALLFQQSEAFSCQWLVVALKQGPTVY